MKTLLKVLLVILCIVIATPAAFPGMQYRLESDSMRALTLIARPGAHVRVDNVPLVDGTPGTLELERFDVFSPDAVIENHDANGDYRVSPPAVAYYRGSVAGNPDSAAFIAVDREVHGLVVVGERRFRIMSSRSQRSPRQIDGPVSDTFIEEETEEDDIAAGVEPTFYCDLDRYGSFKQHPLDSIGASSLHPRTEPSALLTGTATYTIRLAIETDGELNTDLGGSASTLTPNVATYVAGIVGAISTIYKRDLKTDVQLVYLNSFADSSTDPFTEANGDTGTALTNLSNRWSTSPPTTIPHSAAMEYSGKSASAGLAWIDGLGSTSFEYGVVGGLARSGVTYSATPPNVVNPDANLNFQAATSVFDFSYWSIMGGAHELGHIVESDHTHCIPWTAADQTQFSVVSTRAFVDQCYSGEGAGCYTNGTSGAVNANLPPELGTVMSYCHLITSNPGGFGMATRFTFGKSGETSAKVIFQMTQRIAGISPSSPAIIAPGSVPSNSSGNAASVTPVAGLTYLWQIANGTFSGGSPTATGTTVSFSVGTTSPAKLTVSAVTSNGLAATDFVNVNVAAGCAITMSPASGATIGAVSGVAVSQTVTSSGGVPPYTYTLTGTLPTGLSFNTSTGLLSGTTTQTGNFPVSIKSTDNAACNTTSSYTIHVGSCVSGDANADGVVNVQDIFFLINNLFAGGPNPPSAACANPNGIGGTDAADIIYLIKYLFAGGPAPI